MIVNKKKKTGWIVDVTVPAVYKVKQKESEKKDKYQDLAKKWKVTVIPIVIGALGIVTKEMIMGLENLEIKGRVEEFK